MDARKNPRKAVLISGPAGQDGKREKSDRALIDRLSALGYEWEQHRCAREKEAREAAAEIEPREVSLVIISPTAPLPVGCAFRDLAVPVVVMSWELYREMGLTGASNVNDYGVESEVKSVHVIDTNHPLAADLSSSPTVSPEFIKVGWGAPARAGRRVVTLTDDTAKAVVFCYDHDQTMFGLNAPARRVGLFHAWELADYAGRGGGGFVSPYWRFFDAAVEWAAGERPRQFADVFRAEWAEIATRRRDGAEAGGGAAGQPRKSPPPDLAGLALSGGGIRAATFSLGLLQGLHERGLLRLFDYLSTVSGGGYIGGWWSAWLSRDKHQQRGGRDIFPPHELIKWGGDTAEPPDEEEEEQPPGAAGAGEAAAAAEPGEEETAGAGEAAGGHFAADHRSFDELQEVNSEVAEELLSAGRDPVHHLRLFSNYLTPRKGVLSPDTWRAATVISRNLVLTWVVLLPVLIAALLLGKLYFVLQPTSHDPASHEFFFAGGLASPDALRARLALTAWPLLVVLGWLVVAVCSWMVAGGGGDETRREWWAGKLGAAVVAILAGLGLYAFFSWPEMGGVGAPVWVWVMLPAGALTLLAYFAYPGVAGWLVGRRTGDTSAARQWRGEVTSYRVARVQAKLVVVFVIAAFVLVLAGFGHELVNYVNAPRTGALARAGGWLAVLTAVAGSLFTALKNSPSGGSDERLLDENQSLFNRLVFRVTPTLVILVMAVALSWAANLLLGYIHRAYLGGLEAVAAGDYVGRLAYVKRRESQAPLLLLLTVGTCAGILLSLFLSVVETRWRITAPRRWLAALWVVLALYLALVLAGVLFLWHLSPTGCECQPVVTVANFRLVPCDYYTGCKSRKTTEELDLARCFSTLYVCLDRRAFAAIFLLSYVAGWWLIFRLRAGERRRPKRLVTAVLVLLVGVVLAALTVRGVESLYRMGEQTEPAWLPMWQTHMLGGMLLFCLLYVVLETAYGSSDNKRAMWLLTSVYLVLNALLAVSVAVDYSDLQADLLTPESPLSPAQQAVTFNRYVTVLLGQGTFGLFGAALSWVVAMGWMADPNRLSMHDFYRARLVRAYLGASNNYRRRQLKTIREAVEGDDVRLQDLRNCRRGAPYLLVNTTLNLVGGRDLTTAQRSADAFVLSRRYCGSSRTGYRDTREYMGGGLSLGTAVAISGAAASPNMGSKTLTSSLAMLMTFLNVRLGYWAPTPNKKDWRETRARLWPFYMLREFTSQTNDLSTYCYLTDGGHFDNTGLYALVERGCRLIVAADCGADAKPCFQDVGDALRRCRIDFGAEIDLDLAPLMLPKETGLAQSQFAVGSIVYSLEHAQGLSWEETRPLPGETWEACRRRTERARTGVIILFKPAITGRHEPPDVRQYKLENSLFPQQTTVDQWFDEAQFESYRRLGEVCAGALLRELKGAGAPDAPGAARRLMEEASRKFDPRSPFRASGQPSLGRFTFVI